MNSQKPNENQMLEEIVKGLKSQPKILSAKYFYDKRGSELFEHICELKEYYPARTEMGILERYIEDIVSSLGDRPILYEFGSGSSIKTQILLSHLPEIVGYVPIDISPNSLYSAVQNLQVKFPNLKISPLCQDFTEKFKLSDKLNHIYPNTSVQTSNRVAFFPGSTIGNFSILAAKRFLRNAASTLGPHSKLLIGVDSVKDVKVLENAYNDSLGVTRDFNLNILYRLNRELGANFDIPLFKHHAFYNHGFHRIEMHLIASKSCDVRIQNQIIPFRTGESIHTESSHKYDVHEFISLAEKSGFQYLKRWHDERHYFNIILFEVVEDSPSKRADSLRDATSAVFG